MNRSGHALTPGTVGSAVAQAPGRATLRRIERGAQVTARADLELAVDGGEVALHGSHRDDEHVGDVAVAHPLGGLPQRTQCVGTRFSHPYGGQDASGAARHQAEQSHSRVVIEQVGIVDDDQRRTPPTEFTLATNDGAKDQRGMQGAEVGG